MAFSLVGCGDEKSTEKVLATVDGEDVTESQVNELAKFLAYLNGADFTAMEENEQTQVVNSLTIFSVENILVRNALKDEDVINDDVKSQIDDQIKQANEQEEFKAKMDELEISEDVIRYYLESQFYSKAFFDKIVEEDDPVSDEEIQEYYDEHKEEFVSPSSVTVSHILISDAAITEENKDKAEEIRQMALDGEDFEKLVEEFSDDPSAAENKGDIGEVTENSPLVPEFIEASLSLEKEGDISEVVETQFGFHIIIATSDLSPEHQMTVEEASDIIKQILGEEHLTAALQQLKESSDIKYTVEVDPDTGEPPVTLGGGENPEADEPN